MWVGRWCQKPEISSLSRWREILKLLRMKSNSQSNPRSCERDTAVPLYKFVFLQAFLLLSFIVLIVLLPKDKRDEVAGSQLFILSAFVSLSQMGASCGEVDVVCLCEASPCTLYSEAHTPTPVSAEAFHPLKCLWPSLNLLRSESVSSNAIRLCKCFLPTSPQLRRCPVWF